MSSMGYKQVNDRRKAMIKAGIQVIFIAAAIFLIQFTPIKNYLPVSNSSSS